MALNEFAERFRSAVGSKYAHPFWKARVAFYALLRAMDIKKGDEVVVPGYTCVMDVNPVMYVGATPRYADIDPKTFNVDLSSVRKLVSERTRLILAQHTYGIPAPMDELAALAKEKGAWLVEDCCLALGARYQGEKVGTFGHAAYWSFQWNKIMTTGLGGMATVNHPLLAERLAEVVRNEGHSPDGRSASLLGVQRLVHTGVIWPKSSALARAAYRRVCKMGLAIGSSDTSEFRPVMPDGFFRTMSQGQAMAGLRGLRTLERNLAHRKALAEHYGKLLREKGWQPLEFQEEHEPVMVGYPVRVKDKDRVLAEASAKLVELGSWFESPLHPKETPLAQYGYEWGSCPNAEKASQQVVMLPTHPRTTQREARRVVDFLAARTAQEHGEP